MSYILLYNYILYNYCIPLLPHPVKKIFSTEEQSIVKVLS